MVCRKLILSGIWNIMWYVWGYEVLIFFLIDVFGVFYLYEKFEDVV